MRVLLMAISIVLPLAAHSQDGAKRGAAGIGRALQETTGRMIDADLEVEVARRKAEIELEYQRRLRELDRRYPAQPIKPQSPDAQLDAEEATLLKVHPQWERIVTSTAFDTWLEKQSPVMNMTCRTTRQASILASCIEHFFGPPAPARSR